MPSESPSVPVGDAWEPIYSDDFEIDQGLFLGTNKRFDTLSMTGGSWSLRFDNTDVLKTEWFDVFGYSQVSVSFYYQANGIEDGDSFFLEARFDGDFSFTHVHQWLLFQFSGGWVKGTAIIDVPREKHTVQLQFKANGGRDLDDMIYIDDVLFEGNTDPNPGSNTDPSPHFEEHEREPIH